MIQTEKQKEFETLLLDSRAIIHSIIADYCHDYHIRDDLFQEVALRAWNAYDSFAGRSKFATWIGRIARNTAIDRIRRLNKLTTVLTDNIMWQIVDEPYSEPEGAKINYSALAQLTDREKLTLQLRMDGISFEEMGDIMGEPPNRLRVRMHRIKKLLAKSIKSLPSSQ